ncbi:MAG: SMP-30/gluconolactonase/LRE family protein [Candidatus Hydrogenedentota bacterium]|nr:MAG: SMP-30/gluconolactonase/LRE family protein [Candidatus Hydrogenedentota bacterium]
MRRSVLIFPAVFVSLIMLHSFAMAGQKQTVDVSSRALNSSPLFGPEGIALAPDGNIYVGNHDGRIMRVTGDGLVEEFADLNSLPGQRKERISAIGLAADNMGNIYAAALDFQGGSVLKVVGPGKPDSGTVTVYRHGVGMANFVLIDHETATMYVSDSSMFSGGVYRFDMTEETRVGGAADPESELLGKFAYANGLALGPEKKWLYVAETTSGRISRINLETKEPEVFAELGGWMDGIAFDPERRTLFACDNKGGRIIAVDLSGTVTGEVHLTGKEGQCAPASLVFRDSDTIVFTDLWRASLWRALLRRAQYHSYIYQLPVSDIVR